MNVKQLRQQIQSRITVPGVTIDEDGQWTCGFFPKMKNYALMSANGSIETKGGLFRSRAELPFFREMIETLTDTILRENTSKIEEIIRRYRMELNSGELTPADFAKRVCPTKSLADYMENRKARQPHFEALLNAGVTEHPEGSPVVFYRSVIDGKIGRAHV